MVIESIELKNYRNYEELHMELNQGTNILYGDNAQGKTNILESAYVCCTSKSHRGAKDRDIIRFGQDESHIKLQIRKNDVPWRIDMHLKKNKPKGIAINGIPIRRASELFGLANMVFFSPEDLNISKTVRQNGGGLLIWSFASWISCMSTPWFSITGCCCRENRLLKELAFKPEYETTLDIWDEQLVKYGVEVITSRRLFIEQLGGIISGIHARLSGGKEEISVLYDPDIREEDFKAALEKNRSQDIRQKTTLAGPHRDDINFIVNGIDIRRFGSQGQQRTAALSLKLSELELVKLVSRDAPVLLLDDVLSELDGSRQTQLLSAIQDIQTMITCTGLEDFVNHRFPIDKIFKVVDGKVYSQN